MLFTMATQFSTGGDLNKNESSTDKNNYLMSILDPMGYPGIKLPGWNIIGTVPKRTNVNYQQEVPINALGSTPDLLLWYTPHNSRFKLTLLIKWVAQGITKYIFWKFIRSDDDVNTLYDQGRLVTSGFSIYDQTSSRVGGNIVKGAINAIQYSQLPNLSTLTHSNLSASCRNNRDVVVSQPLHYGVFCNAFPLTTEIKELDNSARWNTAEEEKRRWVDGTPIVIGITNLLVPADIFWLVGAFKVVAYGRINWIGNNTSVSITLRLFSERYNEITQLLITEDITQAYYGSGTPQLIFVGTSQSGIVCQSSFHFSQEYIQSRDAPPVTYFVLEVAEANGGVISPGSIISIDVIDHQAANPGFISEGALVSMAGLDGESVLNISGAHNWELIPNLTLQKDVQTNTGGRGDPTDLLIAQYMVSNFNSDPRFRLLYTLPEYQVLRMDGFFQKFASYENLDAYAFSLPEFFHKAMNWLRPALKTIAPHLGSLGGFINPLFSPIGSGIGQAIDSYYDSVKDDLEDEASANSRPYVSGQEIVRKQSQRKRGPKPRNILNAFAASKEPDCGSKGCLCTNCLKSMGGELDKLCEITNSTDFLLNGVQVNPSSFSLPTSISLTQSGNSTMNDIVLNQYASVVERGVEESIILQFLSLPKSLNLFNKTYFGPSSKGQEMLRLLRFSVNFRCYLVEFLLGKKNKIGSQTWHDYFTLMDLEFCTQIEIEDYFPIKDGFCLINTNRMSSWFFSLEFCETSIHATKISYKKNNYCYHVPTDLVLGVLYSILVLQRTSDSLLLSPAYAYAASFSVDGLKEFSETGAKHTTANSTPIEDYKLSSPVDTQTNFRLSLMGKGALELISHGSAYFPVVIGTEVFLSTVLVSEVPISVNGLDQEYTLVSTYDLATRQKFISYYLNSLQTPTTTTKDQKEATKYLNAIGKALYAAGYDDTIEPFFVTVLSAAKIIGESLGLAVYMAVSKYPRGPVYSGVVDKEGRIHPVGMIKEKIEVIRSKKYPFIFNGALNQSLQTAYGVSSLSSILSGSWNDDPILVKDSLGRVIDVVPPALKPSVQVEVIQSCLIAAMLLISSMTLAKDEIRAPILQVSPLTLGAQKSPAKKKSSEWRSRLISVGGPPLTWRSFLAEGEISPQANKLINEIDLMPESTLKAQKLGNLIRLILQFRKQGTGSRTKDATRIRNSLKRPALIAAMHYLTTNGTDEVKKGAKRIVNLVELVEKLKGSQLTPEQEQKLASEAPILDQFTNPGGKFGPNFIAAIRATAKLDTSKLSKTQMLTGRKTIREKMMGGALEEYQIEDDEDDEEEIIDYSEQIDDLSDIM